jgi:DNA-binding transcriptional ArsR family regulator
MVHHSVKSATLDTVFSALSHPTRRAVLTRLARGDASVGELAAPFAISPPAMSKHLRVLEEAGLVKRHLDGRLHRLQLIAAPMRSAAGWIAEYAGFWSQQFDSLARFLDEPAPKPPRKPKRPARGEG